MARIGKLRQNYRGEWASSTAYKIDDVVKHQNGFFISKTDHTSSSTSPTAGLSGTGVTAASTDWLTLSVPNDAARGTSTHIKETEFDAPWQNSSYWDESRTYLEGEMVLWRDSNGIVNTYQAKTNTVTGGTIPSSSSSWGLIANSGLGGTLNHCKVWGNTDNPFFMGNAWSNSEAWNDLCTGTYYDGQKYGVPQVNTYAAGKFIWENNEEGLTGYQLDSQNSSGQVLPPFRYNESPSGGAPFEIPMFPMIYEETGRSGDVPTVRQVVNGYQYTGVLLSDGSYFSCGYGAHGQQGGGENTTRAGGEWIHPGYANVNRSNTTTTFRDSSGNHKDIIKVAIAINANTNTSHGVFALEKTGTNTRNLWSWGYNGYGQLGHGDTTNRNVPTQVTWDASTNGNIVDVFAFGGNYTHTFVITDTGKMFACGYNTGGQLGVGHTTTNVTSFELVKDFSGDGGIRKFTASYYQYGSAAVVTKNNKLYTWGENVRGQLGQEDTTDRNTPTQVSTHTDVQNAWMVGYNQDLTLFFTRGSSNISNTLYGCGENGNYQLATGATTDTGSGAPIPIHDSFDEDITNIFNVIWLGGGGNECGVFLQKYHATLSASGSKLGRRPPTFGAGNDSDNTLASYESSWYMPIHNDTAGFYGYFTSYNNATTNMPKPDTTTAERYRYHRNMRFTTSMNPKRCNIFVAGLNARPHAMVWDNDTGRIWYNGGGALVARTNGPSGDDVNGNATDGASEIVNRDLFFT